MDGRTSEPRQTRNSRGCSRGRPGRRLRAETLEARPADVSGPHRAPVSGTPGTTPDARVRLEWRVGQLQEGDRSGSRPADRRGQTIPMRVGLAGVTLLVLGLGPTSATAEELSAHF